MASAIQAVAFWSYAHEDDALDGGHVLRLADRIRDEFALITAGELRLFVDRDGIEWGDEWRRRIDDALVETTFFIPIVTPRYFTRPECRRELLTFVGRAESLGAVELVLPILYIPVPDLEETNSDEAIALVARMHYSNWTELRLVDPMSEAYRHQIHDLAKRLSDLCESLGERQLAREGAVLEQVEQGQVPQDLQGLLASIDRLLPDWFEAVQAGEVLDAQQRAVTETYNRKLRRLKASRSAHSAQLAVLMRWANDDLPISEQFLRHAETYASRTIQLDPLVHSVVSLAEQIPAAAPLLDTLRAGVEDAVRAIESSERKAAEVRDDPEHYMWMHDFARRNARLSRTWKQVGENYAREFVLIHEANALVAGWAERLGKLDAKLSKEDS